MNEQRRDTIERGGDRGQKSGAKRTRTTQPAHMQDSTTRVALHYHTQVRKTVLSAKAQTERSLRNEIRRESEQESGALGLSAGWLRRTGMGRSSMIMRRPLP